MTLQSAILPPQDLEKRSLGIFQFLEKLTMKNPIQKMYEGLESQGITPGEEVSNGIFIYACFSMVLSLHPSDKNNWQI